MWSLQFSSVVLSLFIAASAGPVLADSANDPSPIIKPCNEKTRLCIGVRSDARPFSYSSNPPGEASSDAVRGPLRYAGYTGYMIRICDGVLAEMVLDPDGFGKLSFGDIGYYDIDKHCEAAAANNTTCPSRFDELGKNFDILCDPATITNDRRDEFVVSPPLFLTGISYLESKAMERPRKACENPDKPLIGLVRGTTAATEGLRALLDNHEMPNFEDVLVDYLKSESSSDPSKLCGASNIPRIKAYDTHTELAKAFCRGEFYYIVGDIEIISENVKRIPGCKYEDGGTTYTNDRYAIFGRTRLDYYNVRDEETKERKLLLAKFFQILTQKVVFNPSILDKAFNDTFVGTRPSRKLEIFFWSVRGGSG